MNNIKDRASLSEPTVQKVARGEHEVPKPRRKRAAPKQKASSVKHVKVDADVQAKVKALRANPRHVQIIDAQTVVIWNHPAPWPSRA